MPHANPYVVKELSQGKSIMTRLKEIRYFLHQDTEMLTKEVQSEIYRGSRIFIASILLMDLSGAAIVEEFMRAFTDFEYVLEDRESFCVQLAAMAAHMPSEIGCLFFQGLMSICIPRFRASGNAALFDDLSD
jgi:hypothetical protein